MIRRYVFGAGVVFAMAAAAAAAPVTRVVVKNPTSQPATNMPVTFGQVFKKGDIETGVLVSGAKAAAQVDVKRKYDDGSVRFAVISLLVPELPAGDTTLELSDGREDQLATPVP
ncbi:MAG: hypothetical protein PHU85_10950, partial [Phycisphaerae bacterium]|nr:hypothetical protein [Phycisphaerae bacterium]